MPAPRREIQLGAFSPGETPAPEPAVPAGPDARSVGEIVAQVNSLLARERALSNVWVRGEISGFKAHNSGHWYFTLKDENANLAAVMWRTANARVKFTPEEGMEVLARGFVGVYPRSSQLQLQIEELRPVGAGELTVRFDQLRRKLDAEGLFAQGRKRSLPAYPRAIGIVTSLEAAALRDMLRVATSRNPGLRILVANARVQGYGAAEEIARAIERMNARDDIDVLIVGRGGGSVEDLWSFNEELVVRAVARSRIPVVSAVGHESDFTLCDLAADVRAATPSNAAELVVPDADALDEALADAELRASAAMERELGRWRQRVDALGERAEHAARRTIAKERELLAAHAARLDALSPLAVLARGYAVVRKGEATVRSAASVRDGDDISIALHDGSIDAKVNKRRSNGPDG